MLGSFTCRDDEGDLNLLGGGARSFPGEGLAGGLAACLAACSASGGSWTGLPVGPGLGMTAAPGCSSGSDFACVSTGIQPPADSFANAARRLSSLVAPAAGCTGTASTTPGSLPGLILPPPARLAGLLASIGGPFFLPWWYQMPSQFLCDLVAIMAGSWQ